MVMGEDEIFDRLVGVLPQLVEPLPCRHGRRARLEADQKILAFDRADIGIAFGGEGVDAAAQDFERFGLFGQVGTRGEGLGHDHLSHR